MGWFENIFGEQEGDDEAIRRETADEARNFVREYYNSPGFKQRLQNTANKYLDNFLDNSDYGWKYVINSPLKIVETNFNPRTEFPDKIPGAKGQYDPDRQTVSLANQLKEHLRRIQELGLIEAGVDPNSLFGPSKEDYQNVAAHEYGHALGDVLKVVNARTGEPIRNRYSANNQNQNIYYEQIIPQFRQNRAYLNLLENENRPWYFTPKTPSYRDRDNPLFYEMWKASPQESYAELINLRESLYRNGIYDSRKANNPFKREHLNEYKKKVSDYNMLFRNYTDDQIVEMMNEVAQNKVNQDNQNLYARKGIKLISKIK